MVMISAGSARGQNPANDGARSDAPKFAYEVVSIRPSRSESGGIRFTDDELYFESTTLESLLVPAYNLRGDYVSGAPEWVKSETYEFRAKMDTETAEALKKLPPRERYLEQDRMLAAVLEDRFHLKVKRGQKEIPTYNLVVAKGGLKVNDADPNNTYAKGITVNDKALGAGSMQISSGRMIAQGVSMDMFADNLAGQVERPVEDKTGLKGHYDFTLLWSPEDARNSGNDATAGSIFSALQEQVGLKLEPAKGMTDTIVVEHVERPTAN
jgi:uncharacterized protein (TIGR03435 family)